MNFSMTKLKINPKTLIIIFLFLLMILVISGLLEYNSRINNVVNLMAGLAENLSITIRKASVNAILSYDTLEEEVNSKLLLQLKYIDHLNFENSVSNQMLMEYCQENNINGINIFNKNGDKVFSNKPKHLIKKAKPEIIDFIKSSNESLIIGMIRSRFDEQNNYAAVIRSSKKGAIVGNINAERLINFQQKLGIGKFINTISEDSSIVYITIQDTIGILAASRNLDSLSHITSDDFLSNIYGKDDFKWRFSEFSEDKIFEGILPFKVQNINYGLIRIALNFKPIQTIQNETLRNVIIKIIILLIISFILIAYSISSQNVFLLEKEKEKISNHVYKLQTDLRQKEKLSAMGQLAAGVAHEIRNPLNAISMSVQRIGLKFKPTKDAEIHDNLIKTIRKEIKRITIIIEEFLQFAKPSPLQIQTIILNDLIQNTVDLYKHNIEQKEINLIWHNPGEIKFKIDPDKIKQCLVNLLENAIKSTSTGGTIEINLSRKSKSAIIIIKDTGEGIAEENLSKIFNLYFTTKPEGTGFGLAQVYQIIADHNGTIEVESEIGKGAQFTIKLNIAV